MLTRILLTVSLLGSAACADLDADRDLDDQSSAASSPDTPDSLENPKPHDGRFDPPNMVLMSAEAQCMSDGPCSPACTGSMVINLHVPTGECVTFDCTGEAGAPDVGGCHP